MSDYVEQLREMARQILNPQSKGKRFFNDVASELEIKERLNIMNEKTKKALKEFVQEVIDFGYSVSSVSGTDSLQNLVTKGEKLIDRLDHDETIP